MPAFIIPIPCAVRPRRYCSSLCRARLSRAAAAAPSGATPRRAAVHCTEQQAETPDAVRALLTSEGKADQQKGVLLVRHFDPPIALDLLLLSIKTSKNEFIRASATIAIGDIKYARHHVVRAKAIGAMVDLLATEDDYGIRSAAAAGIGYITGADSTIVSTMHEALNRALIEDSEWQVQFSCLASLGSLRDKRAVPTLLGWLSNQNDLLVQAAIGALGDIGDETAVPELLKVLGSTDMMTRQRLAQSLGQMQRCAAEPAVIDALRTLSKDQSMAVRDAATEALRSFGCPNAAKADIKSDDELLDIEVANLLEGNEVGNAGESASYALRRRLERSFDKQFVDSHWNKSDRQPVGSETEQTAPPADTERAPPPIGDAPLQDGEGIRDMKMYEELTKDLKYGSPSRQVLAAIHLRKFDPTLALQAILDSHALDANVASQRLRSVSINILARAGAISNIIDVLQRDPEQNVRSACCDALMELDGSPVAISACIRAFEADVHWLVRISAAIALATIGKGHDAVERALIDCLRHNGIRDLGAPQDSVVRRHAITALGLLGCEGALQAFKILLGEDGDTAVRSRVAAALRGIPCNESVQVLRLLIDDENEEVSQMAQGSLDALANKGLS